MSKYISAKLKRKVGERARACCEYCRSQAKFSPNAFAVEHIIPRAKNGSNDLENLALSCQGCNNHKHTKTEGIDSITNKKAPLFHPRKEKWDDHFSWNNDFSTIIGTTPTGRATVTTLHLNRKELINLRRLLHEKGEHPPLNS